jgi:hypothetical protein
LQLLQEQGADFLLTVKANKKTLHRQIRSQFQGKRKIPFVATNHEISHGRAITWTLRAKQAPEHISEAWIGTSWIVEVAASGTRDGKPFHAPHLFLSSLRTTPEALLRMIRQRLSGVNYVGGSRQLRRRVGDPNPLPGRGLGRAAVGGWLAAN